MALDKASLERLIEASPDIVVATDASDGSVAFYNDGALENLGYTRDEIIGSPVQMLYSSLEEAKRVMAAMRGPDHGGKGRALNLPAHLLAKDGTEIPVAISGVILYDDAGQEQGTIGFCKDLREMQRKDQLAVLGEVAVGLSHEINNPLTVIASQASLLERDLGAPARGESGHRRLELIRHEILRIQDHLERLHRMAEQREYSATRYLGESRMIDLSERRAQAGPLAGKHLLVVDDDAAVRESVSEILQAAGCLVEQAENGRVALERVRAVPFDLVLSDVVMPEMDGYELYTTVRREQPGTHVVLMTAFYYDKDHIIKRSRLEGLEGVLFKKPLDAERLKKTLGDLLTPPPPAPS